MNKWIGGFAALAVLAAGCTGPSETSDDDTPATNTSMDVEGAQTIVAKYLAEPTFEDPGAPVDAAAAAGKLIFNIPASSSIPILESLNKNLGEAAKRAGLKYKNYPNQGQPQQWTQGVQQAITDKADVLILSGAPDPALLQPQLKRAREAGIKVIVSYLYPDGTPLPKNVDALVPLPSLTLQALITDYAISHSSEPVNALILVAREFPSTAPLEAAVIEEIKTRCGKDCSYKVIDSKLADWATKVPTKVQSALASDPEVNWIIPIYDGMAQPAAAGVNLAGRKGKVKITTGDASLGVLKSIRDDDVVVQDAGYSSDWIAWATVDQSLRVITGSEPLATAKLPIRMFDRENIDAVGNPPVQDQGWGDSYIDGYLKLWGLS